MEKVISLLFDIETKANKIIEHTNEEKNRRYGSLEKDLTQMEKDIEADTTSKLQTIQEQIDQDFLKEKATFIENSKQQLNELTNRYEKNHDKLVTQLFECIIGS